MRKNREFPYLALALLVVWCPLFMGAFDKDKPSSSTSLRNSNPEILANWSALETAIAQDHEFSTGGTNSGNHEVLTMEEESSAGASSTNELHVQAIDGGSGQPELAITSEDGNELQMTKDGDLFSSAGLTVTNASTFNGSITLGAGDDLIGSSTSDITINTNKFTVAGDTGNTLVAGTLTVTGVATLGDSSQMATSTAPTSDADLANKKYVDDGANKVTDGSVVTGYRYVSVNDGAVQQVFTKYFTGSLDADSTTTVAHGVTYTNILFVSVLVENSSSSIFRASGYGEGTQSILRFDIQIDSTNISFTSVGDTPQSDRYRIKMDYTI